MDNDATAGVSQSDPMKKTASNTLVRKLSVASVHCRICYDNEKPEELIAPCHCKGTVAFVHRSCLENWLGESGTSSCELCHYLFKTERTPKYSSSRSIWYWLRYGPRYPGTGVRGDVIACTIITPLAIVVTYVCLYSSEYYSQQKFSQIPAAKWTSVSLMLMIGIMLIGYYLWVHSVIRLHARMWYNWWQRSCVVRYIPPSVISLHEQNDDQTVLVPNNTPIPVARNEIEDLSDSESVINFESVINIDLVQNEMLSQGEGFNIQNDQEVVVNIDEEPRTSSDDLDLK
ncbi:E3 ubiquitin-protein ligase MARCHF3-like [Euwallacea similis]|uniref:E3 ubiquitin-protein ligase MARCHF3-like n=1 Tax=Euwallacea similis TaxID=1736056 RepID=UPI00344FB5A9